MVMTYTKPAVRNAWADTAVAITDIVDPGNAYVTQGWLQNPVPPPRQYFNWLLNWSAAGIRYFMQRGIVSWDALETYQIGAIVNQGNALYQSKINANTGNTPSSFTGTQWGAINGFVYATPTTTANIASYVLATTLTTTLASYVLQTSLTSQLAAYVTNASLASTLTSYLTIASAASTYVSNSSLATTLASYLTTSSAATIYAPKISPALSGTPTTPTAAVGTATTQIASTAFAVGTNTVSGNNGFFKLPNGFIVNFGYVTGSTGGAQPVAFTQAFATKCYSITATSSVTQGTILVSNPASSLTGFTLTNGAAGANTCWMAIGK
jgi:hypothetical protein